MRLNYEKEDEKAEVWKKNERVNVPVFEVCSTLSLPPALGSHANKNMNIMKRTMIYQVWESIQN